MATVKQLQTCPKKAWFSSLKLKSTDKSVYTLLEDAILAMLKDKGSFSALRNASYVENILEEMLPEEIFSMKHEREENISRATERIVRMGEVMDALCIHYVGVGKRYVHTVGSKSISGNYSLQAERDGVLYAARLMFASAGMSLKAGTKSFIGNDVDLYVQQLSTNEIPAIISLTGSESWGSEVKEYSMDEHAKKGEGRFWFSFDFNSLDHTGLDEQVENLLSLSVGKNAKENKNSCINCWYKDLCQIDTSNDVYEEEVETVSDLQQVVVKREWADAQNRLANLRSGEAKVFAVAGSGKTTSIVRLVTELLHDGVSDKNITLCTFTNKGVMEMKSKLQQLNNVEPYNTEEYTSLANRNVHIVSLNGLGYEICIADAVSKGKEPPKLIDEDERLVYIAEIADKYPVIDGLNYTNPFFKMFTAEGAIHTISRSINLLKRTYGERKLGFKEVEIALLSESSIIKKFMVGDQVNVQSVTTLTNIYNELLGVMAEKNVITYDDQIFNAVKVLKENPEVLKEFREKCKYLIVDEFQDTGLEQLRMIEQLYVPSEKAMLVVVGDTSQAIMGFRGVGNENIDRFSKAYPNALSIDMNANFRSTREICDIAENAMRSAGVTVALETEKHGSPVTFQESSSRNESCQKASEKVEEWLSDGVALSDIAVICRTRSELLEVRKQLNDAGIPSTISVAELFKDDGQLTTLHNLVKYVGSEFKDLKALAVYLRRADKDSFDNAVDTASYVGLQGALIKERYENASDSEKYGFIMEDISSTFLNKTSVLEAFMASEKDKSDSFARLSHELDNVFEMNGTMSAAKDDTVYDAVTLTTVHSAKGREWNNVIVCTNGFKPVSGMVSDADGGVKLSFDAEEVRTLFVAVTRAKEELEVIGNCYWNACLTNKTSLKYEELSKDGVRAKAPAKKKN